MTDTETSAGGRISAMLQALYDELVLAFPTYPVVPNPVEQASVPSVVIYPDSPMVEAEDIALYGGGGYQVNLQVLVYLSRMTDRELYAKAADTIAPMRAAVGAVPNASWRSMTAQPVEVGGNQYMAAAHVVALYT